MSALNAEDIFHIAKLSRLHLEEAEATRYADELAAILNYASQLPELAAKAELSSLRSEDDIAELYTTPQDLLKNAVAIENGYVKVPAILDKESVG
jgi:aspartyl-tRNA(Asn)/glutamyl-tRNA(Gln) amidotransferase subunit C